MSKISQNEIYLPAIQRRFVWGPDRIEKLFDSIMRGYPIGTFLFWFVRGEAKNEYTFYKFIQDYHERDRALNEVAPKPDLRDEFIGVLDGQQRLNSMYVALQGSYAYKRKHGRWTDDGAFPRRDLYINLLYQPGEDDESGVAYKFSFLTADQAEAVDDGQYWFRVKDALAWPDLGKVFQVIVEASAAHPTHQTALQQRAAPLLNTLWQRLCVDDSVNYFSIHEQELDSIVEIFVRVNSTGVPLAKTDLLFSSIVAHWDEGRASIEATLQTLNAKGNQFAFDNDFVMRCCLVLADLPILFKVNSFRKENIDRIKQGWPQIKQALEAMVDLLVEWGFCGETLPTLNAVIPIAYFAYKGGDLKVSQADLRQYLVRALVNRIFASKTDRVLGAIRDRLREPRPDGQGFRLRSERFSLAALLQPELSKDWSLEVDDSDIEEYMAETKGPYTFMLLSLLYPHLKFDQVKFHQDHMHPWSQFSPKELKKLGASEDQIARWQDDRNRLPNLQLLEGTLNQSKNATPFETWIDALPTGTRNYFVQSHFVPAAVGLKLADFDDFYKARKQLLQDKLKDVFQL